MILEIVTPEAVIFHSEVNSVAVPGINGSFQMLKDHAPIVSLLDKGSIRIKGNQIEVMKEFADQFSKEKDELILNINGGTVEMNNNKIIILAD